MCIVAAAVAAVVAVVAAVVAAAAVATGWDAVQLVAVGSAGDIVDYTAVVGMAVQG